jgi:hypothetical protein
MDEIRHGSRPINCHYFASQRGRAPSERGVFFWGIGNAIGPSVIELLRRLDSPEVLFSPIKSTPRKEDVAPESVAAWTTALGLDGKPYTLPERSLITSRFNVDRRRHYALVCWSETPFENAVSSSSSTDTVQLSELRNILSGRPLGGSQVTSVVMREPRNHIKGPEYDISFKARLVQPYFIQLSNPRPIPADNAAGWTLAVDHHWNGNCAQDSHLMNADPLE